MKAISFNQNWTYAPGIGDNGFSGPSLDGEEKYITLPHDATVHEFKTPDAIGKAARGFYPAGAYVYKKKFDAPQSWKNQRVFVEFEGAYRNAMVFINDNYAGQCPNGYAGFTIEMNPHLKYGDENEITVYLSTALDSRWYAGAGLYRPVNLYVSDLCHIKFESIRLTTVDADAEAAAINAEVVIENDGFAGREVTLEITLYDSDKKAAAYDKRKLHVSGRTGEKISQRIYIKNPHLWDLDDPYLYSVSVKLSENNEMIDEAEIETFGIRRLSLDPLRGLRINGKSFKLYGGCIHHDNGVIGAASVEAAEFRRVRLLKESGYNAIRMAHHPMSKALLKACDICGVAVMDELSDMWHQSKTANDYGHEFEYRYEEDVAALVAKDYNHPSVVMYSMGNEIPESGKVSGAIMYRKLARLFRQEDHTRYLTAGLNNMAGNIGLMQELMADAGKEDKGELNANMADLGSAMSAISMIPAVVESTRESYESMDIWGYNYAADRYLHDDKLFTNHVSVGAETFPKDLAYNWQIVKGNPSVIGDFSWTSWDYLGEAGIGRDMYKDKEFSSHTNPYPWTVAYDADFDITGERTPQGYYREIVVDHRTEPYIAVEDPAHYEDQPKMTAWSWPGTLSSWTLGGFEGKPVRVEVYGKGDEAELFINDKSMGRQTIPDKTSGEVYAFKTVFDVKYIPGTVRAVIYKDAQKVGSYELKTAGTVCSLAAEAEETLIGSDDRSLAFIHLRLKDSDGNNVTDSDRKVKVKVEGAGELMGLGSGDPCNAGNFFDDAYTTFYGHLLAVVRPTNKGDIKVTAEADGLAQVSVTVTAE